MNKVVSALLKFGLPVLISAGLVWFLYKNIDLKAIERILNEDVDYRWFAPVIVVSILSHVFRAMRWRLQLHVINVKPPLSVLVNSIFGTYFLNLLVPRLGEVWRAGYVARRERAPFSQVLGTIVGDRLSDTATVALLTVLAFFLAHDKLLTFFGQDSGEKHSSWLIIAFVAAIVVCVVAGYLVWRSKAKAGLMARAHHFLTNLWDGFATIIHMEGKWWFLFYTVLIWLCYFLQLLIAAESFSITCDLGAGPILVLFVLSSLGMAVPSNGGLGPWQMAIIFGLSLYGIGTMTGGYDPQASAFAWLVWGIQTILLIVLGIYAFVAIALDRGNKKTDDKQQ